MSDATREQLKPCPFCGKEPVVRGHRVQCDDHTYALNVDDWNDQIAEARVTPSSIGGSEPKPLDGDACQRIYMEALHSAQGDGTQVESEWHRSALVNVYAAGQRSVARSATAAAWTAQALELLRLWLQCSPDDAEGSMLELQKATDAILNSARSAKGGKS